MARTVGLVFNEPVLEPEAVEVPTAEPQVPEEEPKKGRKKKEA